MYSCSYCLNDSDLPNEYQNSHHVCGTLQMPKLVLEKQSRERQNVPSLTAAALFKFIHGNFSRTVRLKTQPCKTAAAVDRDTERS